MLSPFAFADVSTPQNSLAGLTCEGFVFILHTYLKFERERVNTGRLYNPNPTSTLARYASDILKCRLCATHIL